MPIPRVDPAEPFNGPEWIARPLARFARTSVGRWLGINVLTRVDPWLLRATGGRASIFGVYPHVLLTVPGRRSGIPRTVPLLYFTAGDEVVVIASSFGRPEHPAWYANVMAHPEVQLSVDGEVQHPHTAREVHGDERDALFEQAVLLYPGYGDYAARTEGTRRIPVLALSPS